MKRDLKALQRRRLRAARMLEKGVPEAEVAQELGVSRQSVNTWASLLAEGGKEALKSRPLGRPGSFDAAARRKLAGLLKRRRLRGRVSHRAMDPASGTVIDCQRVWLPIQRSACMAAAAGDGLQLPTADGARHPTRRAGDSAMEALPMAGAKKNAEKRGQTIIFIDESGLSERPTRVRTWAPRGQTPVLQYSFSWHQLSAIAGVTFWQFYFRLFPGTIKGPQIVAFLQALRRQIPGPLLIIWDGLRAHRSKLVRRYVEGDGVDIQLAFLPAYAPELNPVEYLWGYLKTHELGNLCASTLHQVSDFARRRLRSMQRRPTLVCVCWEQAELPV